MTTKPTTKEAAKSKSADVGNDETVKLEKGKEQKVISVEEIKQPRVYKEDDMIMCRSITGGKLINIGAKSESRYVFANRDYTCEVEVRDLNSLKAKKSKYLYEPLFVIEDEEFLEQPRWKDIKNMYETAKSADIDKLLSLSNTEFRNMLEELPKGYAEALVEEVATRIHNDEFDSLQKIKAIDEICGKDLRCLLQ